MCFYAEFRLRFCSFFLVVVLETKRRAWREIRQQAVYTCKFSFVQWFYERRKRKKKEQKRISLRESRGRLLSILLFLFCHHHPRIYMHGFSWSVFLLFRRLQSNPSTFLLLFDSSMQQCKFLSKLCESCSLLRQLRISLPLESVLLASSPLVSHPFVLLVSYRIK